MKASDLRQHEFAFDRRGDDLQQLARFVEVLKYRVQATIETLDDVTRELTFLLAQARYRLRLRAKLLEQMRLRGFGHYPL